VIAIFVQNESPPCSPPKFPLINDDVTNTYFGFMTQVLAEQAYGHTLTAPVHRPCGEQTSISVGDAHRVELGMHSRPHSTPAGFGGLQMPSGLQVRTWPGKLAQSVAPGRHSVHTPRAQALGQGIDRPQKPSMQICRFETPSHLVAPDGQTGVGPSVPPSGTAYVPAVPM
jgi:hypothetical protein